MEWQPIETSPIGEDVLVFFPELVDAYQIMVCHRFPDEPSAWYQQDADNCPDAVNTFPTHWMPLPAPPEV